MPRNLLHHAAGIASVGLTIALLFVAYVIHDRRLGFLLVVIAFAPGYFALRYLRGFGWRVQ